MNAAYSINATLMILCFWCIPWWVYNAFIRSESFHPMGTQVLPTPNWLSCGIPYVSTNPAKNDCETVKLDAWSVGHLLIYFTLGLLVPGMWIVVFLISIACETFEYTVGWRARWLMDPLVNMVGYGLGHLFYIDLRHWTLLKRWETALILVGSLTLLLFLNRPATNQT
jgi:hypothetical protein